MKRLKKAIKTLNCCFGGYKWDIVVGPVVFEPDGEFKPYRCIKVNGHWLDQKMPVALVKNVVSDQL